MHYILSFQAQIYSKICESEIFESHGQSLELVHMTHCGHMTDTLPFTDGHWSHGLPVPKEIAPETGTQSIAGKRPTHQNRHNLAKNGLEYTWMMQAHFRVCLLYPVEEFYQAQFMYVWRRFSSQCNWLFYQKNSFLSFHYVKKYIICNM